MEARLPGLVFLVFGAKVLTAEEAKLPTMDQVKLAFCNRAVCHKGLGPQVPKRLYNEGVKGCKKPGSDCFSIFSTCAAAIADKLGLTKKTAKDSTTGIYCLDDASDAFLDLVKRAAVGHALETGMLSTTPIISLAYWSRSDRFDCEPKPTASE